MSTDTATPSDVTPDEARNLVLRYIHTHNERDLDGLMSVISSDILAYYPSLRQPLRGAEVYRNHIRDTTFKGASRFLRSNTLVADEIAVEPHENRALLRWHFQAVVKGGCCSVFNEGMNTYRFKRDKTSGRAVISLVRTEVFAEAFPHTCARWCRCQCCCCGWCCPLDEDETDKSFRKAAKYPAGVMLNSKDDIGVSK
eukprot:CAMPEP_0184662912 /NCGR_PEP_ID=MMETSP0308-20130426/45579_1 /TAXON_ID=38269 /ORGANISM="Gloeochaete witrockiana, Strain SAG 46.84" /LENGTH=197 /DNA_ID=CAMNT_0027105261 /DNA_START=1 /DNA_END=594 /DNA_ORIENTATION=+